MKKRWLVLLAVGMIAGCLSTQTKGELDAANRAVSDLTVAVAAAQAQNLPTLSTLQAQLAAAKTNLLAVQEKATNERVGSGATIGSNIIDFAKPFASALFPLALIPLNILGTVATSLKDKYGAK